MSAAKEIMNTQEALNWHWRNNMRIVRFFMLDARAALPFLLLLVYLRWSSVILAVIFTTIFYLLERKGLTFAAALRNLRQWIVGRNRPGWISIHRKRFTDWG
ncbi:MAG: IcmT/TraK family protein [Alphaproteobacteria bacterium]|nr:IcmT/TraK family protein [Alphaproteobacteria bacterium]